MAAAEVAHLQAEDPKERDVAPVVKEVLAGEPRRSLGYKLLSTSVLTLLNCLTPTMSTRTSTRTSDRKSGRTNKVVPRLSLQYPPKLCCTQRALKRGEYVARYDRHAGPLVGRE